MDIVIPEGADGWAALRTELLDTDRLNLNPGTLGTTARPVLAAMAEFHTRTRGWPLGQHEQGRAALRAARERLRALCPLPNPVLGHGSTAQMAAWMSALVGRFGRVRLLTSTEEHEGAVYGMLRHPAFIVDEVAPEALVDIAAERRHDVILCSEITWTAGRRLPLAAMRAVSDALFIADAAQVVGLDQPFADADLIVASLHKWVAGPPGTGVTWMSPRAIAELTTPVAAGHAVDGEYALGAFEPAGAQDFARWAGLDAALELMAAVGPATARARSRQLGARLAEGLAELLTDWDLHFMGEAGWQRAPTVAPGHVVVMRSARDPYPLYRALDAAQVHVKCIKGPGRQQLRLGVPWYEDEARIAEVLRRVDVARRCL